MENEIARLSKKEVLEEMQLQLSDRISRLEEMKSERDRLLKVDPRFAFLSKEGEITKEEFIAVVGLKGFAGGHLFAILQRGIGIHHPGLGTKYRLAVERLFRMKRLKVDPYHLP